MMENNSSNTQSTTALPTKTLRNLVQEHLKNLYGFDDAKVEEFLPSCCMVLSKDIEKAHACIANDDIEALSKVMHSMKGSLLNLGLGDLSAKTLELEKKCKQGADVTYKEDLLNIEQDLSVLLVNS